MQSCDHILKFHGLPPVTAQEGSPAWHLGGKPGMGESLHQPGDPSQASEEPLEGCSHQSEG